MKTTIIICNQLLSINKLNDILEKIETHKVVCSTHAFFDSEIQLLSESAKSDCDFYDFTDFFSDQDLWDIDEFALRKIKETNSVPGSGGLKRFQAEMIERKSALLYEKLCKRFCEIQILVVDGLGISADWWESVGAKRIDVQQRKTFVSGFIQFFRKILAICRASSNWCEALVNNQQIVFFSKTTRISHRLNGDFRFISIWKRLVVILSNKWIYPYKKDFIAATTLHDLYRLKRPMLIFQDGHFPSNYSPGHLWEYESYHAFVPSNPFSDKWLKICGRKTVNIYEFNDPEMKEVVFSNSSLDKILIILGHAGDWSALINRSDTCHFVTGVKRIANLFENFKFRIRLHPTMNSLEHEGPNSSLRILEEIKSWKATNVEISSYPLTVDLEWADFVVSEYSQVLIDSWVMGKLGASLNVTGRRSFMQDYNQLGFINAESVDHLILIFKQDVKKLVKHQNEAVEVFNQKMKDWSKLC